VYGLLVDEPSVTAICGPVDEAAVSDHFGVLVPIPSTVREVSNWKRVLLVSADPLENCTAPLPPDAFAEPRQVLFTEKQPPVKLKPTLEVLVANPFTVKPVKVVVPKPVDEIENGAVAVSTNASEVVAIFKVPPLDCMKKCFAFADALLSESVIFGVAPATFKMEFGDVVPMPIHPEFTFTKREDVAVSCVPAAAKYVVCPATPVPTEPDVKPVAYTSMTRRPDPPAPPADPLVPAAPPEPPAPTL